VVFADLPPLSSRSFGTPACCGPPAWRVRIVLLAVIGSCAMLPAALRSAAFVSAMLSGAVLGVALGLYGASRTRFVTYRDRLHYVPHTYTGIAVSLLFLGRLAYRFMQTYVGTHAVPTQAGGATDSLVRSPLTAGLLFVLIGYYVCYYSLVLYKSKHLKPEDIDIEPVAAAP
jgi:hypothetical protein